MNNRDYYEYREDESVRRVSTVKVIREALKNWKWILLFGLITGMALGGMKMISVRRSRETTQVKYEAYQVQMDAYSSSVTSISEQIATTQEKIAVRQQYMNNSIKMQLDPYNTPSAVAYLQINIPELNADELGENTYAERKIVSIQRTFYDELLSGAAFGDLADKYGIETYYLAELIAPWYEVGGNTFRVLVRHNDVETASALLDDVIAFMEEAAEDYQGSLGEFSFTIIGKDADVVIDSDIASYQSNKIAEVTSLQSTMSSLQTSLASLQAPETVEPYNKVTLLVNGVKFGVIGLVLGIILAMMFFVVVVIGKGVILEPEEIDEKYALRNLTSGLGTKKKKISEGADFALAQIENLVIDTKIHTIALVGTVTAEKLERLSSVLVEIAASEKTALTFVSAGRIDVSAEAVRKLKKCDAVVLVEELGKSKHTSVCKEVEILLESGKDVLGTIYF